jgi:PAS domain S-box-containing protein
VAWFSPMNSLSAGKGKAQLMVAAACGIAASCAMFGVVRHLEGVRAEAHFLQVADQSLAAVRINVAGAVDTLSLIASHFEAAGPEGASRRAFATLVAPALANHRYLQALEWIPRVDRAARSRYEVLARADGMPQFRFTELRKDGALAAAGERDQYFPVFYVEPLAGNERALGYDLASNPVRLRALAEARDTAHLVATGRIRLVQEKGDQYGTLIFAPVYKAPRTHAVGDRAEALMGFALSVVRIGDLISGADAAQSQLDGSHLVDIHLFDGAAPQSQRQLYPSTPETTPEQLLGRLHAEARLEAGGRSWLVLATPGAGFTSLPVSAGSVLVLVFGLLVTGVCLLYFRAKLEQSTQKARSGLEMEAARERLEAGAADLAERARLAALQAEIGNVLTQRDSLRTALQRCAEAIVRHLDAAFARIWTLKEDQGVLELEASAGMYTHINGAHARVAVGSLKIGRIAQDRRPHLTNAVVGDPEVGDQDWARREGMVAFAGYPLIIDDRLVGVVALFARKPLVETTLQSLASVANAIAVGIERKRADEALRLSEKRFRVAAENASDVVFVWDIETNRVRAFDTTTDHMTESAGDLPTTFDEFVSMLHPDDCGRVLGALQAHIETRAPFRQEYRLVDRNGAVRHWSGRGAALWNIAGEPYEFIGVRSDITERKNTEAALLRLAAIVESSEAAIVSVSLSGDVLTWNAAAQRIYGYSWKEMKDRDFAALMPPELMKEWADILGKVAKGESVEHLETVAQKKDGGRLNVLVTVSPLRDAGGEITGASSIITDITERKFLERQLAQAQKLESIGQLAAGIAHEINTPIQYVGDNTRFLRDAFVQLDRVFQGYDKLLAALDSGTDAAQFVADLQALAKATRVSYLRAEIPKSIEDSLDGVARVATIVRAIKEFSHPGPSEKTALDINHAIESTVLVSRNEWKYVAELETELDPDMPVVQCVPGEFNQVILNLIINAAHAIADVVGSKPETKGTITVSTRRDGDWAVVRVRDTGTGIPEAVRPNIFNPFFTTKGVGKGTGQGLSIAHTVVVQKHGGTITFDTEVGSGTTFIVRIPIGESPSGEGDSA